MAQSERPWGITKLRRDLAQMTWKQRFEHLWTYYNWVLVVLIVAILLVAMIASLISNKQIVTLFGGMTVNTSLSEEAAAYLDEDMERWLQAQDKQQVNLYSTFFGDLQNSQDPEYDMTAANRVLVMVTAKELDYIMMDERSLSRYINQALFTNLHELLTPEQLAMFENKIVYVQVEETGEKYPVALDLSDTAFAAECNSEKLFIAFPNNTGRAFTASQFLDYLLAWKA